MPKVVQHSLYYDDFPLCIPIPLWWKLVMIVRRTLPYLKTTTVYDPRQLYCCKIAENP